MTATCSASQYETLKYSKYCFTLQYEMMKYCEYFGSMGSTNSRNTASAMGMTSIEPRNTWNYLKYSLVSIPEILASTGSIHSIEPGNTWKYRKYLQFYRTPKYCEYREYPQYRTGKYSEVPEVSAVLQNPEILRVHEVPAVFFPDYCTLVPGTGSICVGLNTHFITYQVLKYIWASLRHIKIGQTWRFFVCIPSRIGGQHGRILFLCA